MEVPHPHLEEVVEVEFHYFLVLLVASEVEERLVSRTENWYPAQVMEEVEVVVVVEAGHELILRDSPVLENRHLVIVQGVVVRVGVGVVVVH